MKNPKLLPYLKEVRDLAAYDKTYQEMRKEWRKWECSTQSGAVTT